MTTGSTESEEIPPPRGGLSGSPRSGMREVAEAAGVAMSSVSRVLSGHPDVSPAMRTRVLKAVADLHYKPDILAQSLRRRETMTVGFVVGDISNPVVSQIVKGAELKLRDAGYTMLLTNSLVDPELDRRHIELLRQRRADGLLLLPVSEDHPPMIRALERLDIPTVVIERDLPASVGAACVFSDHRAGMDPAVEHLLDLGHRHIAFIAGQPVRATRERVASLKAVFTRRGLPPSYQVYGGSYSTEHGARITAQLLSAEAPPTAIIAGSNQIMVGALQVLSNQGVAVGRDLSFVGCDDITVAQIYRPQIAVLDRDLVALGTSAAELLLRQLRENAEADSVIMHPTRFIARPSCGPAPGSD
jgi:LacI family transcriptional regulator